MPRGGPMGGRQAPEKAKNFKGAMKRLFSELKPFKLLIFISLILAMLGSIMSIMAPNQLSKLTDKIAEGIASSFMDMNAITKIALLIGAFYITSAVFTFVQSISMTYVSNSFAKKLRSSISKKINKN